MNFSSSPWWCLVGFSTQGCNQETCRLCGYWGAYLPQFLCLLVNFSLLLSVLRSWVSTTTVVLLCHWLHRHRISPPSVWFIAVPRWLVLNPPLLYLSRNPLFTAHAPRHPRSPSLHMTSLNMEMMLHPCLPRHWSDWCKILELHWVSHRRPSRWTSLSLVWSLNPPSLVPMMIDLMGSCC